MATFRFRAWKLLVLSVLLVLVPGRGAAQDQPPPGGSGAVPTPSASAPAVEAKKEDEKAPAETPNTLEITNVSPADVVRGSPVTVTGKFFPKDPAAIFVSLGGIDIGHPLSVTDTTSFVFIVPEEGIVEKKKVRIPFEPLLLRVAIAAEAAQAGRIAPVPFNHGYVRVAPESPVHLKLVRVEPNVVPLGIAKVALIGEGMGGNVADYVLLSDGQEFPLCAELPCAGFKARFSSPHQLEIDGPFGGPFLGSHQITLRAGNFAAEGEFPVRFIPYDASVIKGGAFAVSLLVLLGIVRLAAMGVGTFQIGPSFASKTLSGLRAFLLDPETDTYSLKNFQLCAWLAAAVLAYCYLTLSRGLAQGKFDMADMPENLVSILGISLATTAASIGVTVGHGAKGSGSVHPSFADLITTGGVASVERLQFFTFTLIAIASFLFSVFLADPASIAGLPAIPERLLWLSGVSAAGYVGGKLVRKPGPILDEVLFDPKTLTLMLLGQNLDVKASVEIDGTSLTPFIALDATGTPQVQVVDPPQATDFAKTLRVPLAKCDPAWADLRKTQLTLTIVNQDGQCAVWPFPIEPAARTAIGAAARV